MESKAISEKKAQIEAIAKQILEKIAKSKKESDIDAILAGSKELEELHKKKFECEEELCDMIHKIRSEKDAIIDADVAKYWQIVQNPSTSALAKSAWESIVKRYDLAKFNISMGNVEYLKHLANPLPMDDVKIGKQKWAKRNLDVSVFRNGDPIPQAKTKEEWKIAGEQGKPAWCYYDNDPENGKKYGR